MCAPRAYTHPRIELNRLAVPPQSHNVCVQNLQPHSNAQLSHTPQMTEQTYTRHGSNRNGAN
ncbi:hypothetical protein DM02DRAFT_617195 [Periconia macrospinosa]|uniref:Uncharacterized protein n=1 Tax=Periconia macrospinosa TaxID=97972 RepID=A0A2V1DH59_9PLEO|nr:hypothetical protein DM02DRAFT_617195 [Periconia macrospinosa]